MQATVLTDTDYVTKQLETFFLFMRRDGFSDEMATEEFARLSQTVDPRKDDFSAYLRISRVGSRYPLDRRGRIAIAHTFCKASEHAYFAFLVERGRDMGLTEQEASDYALTYDETIPANVEA